MIRLALLVALLGVSARATVTHSLMGCVVPLGELATDMPIPGPGIHQGTPVALRKISDVTVPRGAKVFLLGDGEEAFVYRVVPSRGESYVLRLQKDDAFLPLGAYKRKMRFLEEVLSDDESGEPLTGSGHFRVLGCKDTIDNKVLRLDDVRGETLEAIVDRLGPEHETAKRLVALFDARSADLALRAKNVTALATSRPMRSETTRGNPFRYESIITPQKTEGGGVVGASITWRNVIVDPQTFSMTIIDPD